MPGRGVGSTIVIIKNRFREIYATLLVHFRIFYKPNYDLEQVLSSFYSV